MSGLVVFLVIVFFCWLIIRPGKTVSTWEIRQKNPIGFFGFLFRIIVVIIVLCILVSMF